MWRTYQPKKDEVEAETKEKLKKIVKLWEEQKNKNKQIDARLYKQAGNSVCVPVINRIAENILEAIK